MNFTNSFPGVHKTSLAPILARYNEISETVDAFGPTRFPNSFNDKNFPFYLKINDFQ